MKDRFIHLVLADPTFHIPSSVDIVIGADLFSKILTGDLLIVANNLPSAMNTVIDYVIIGPTDIANQP